VPGDVIHWTVARSGSAAARRVLPFSLGRQAHSNRHAVFSSVIPTDLIHRLPRAPIPARVCAHHPAVSLLRDLGLTHPEALVNCDRPSGFLPFETGTVSGRTSHNVLSGRDPNINQLVLCIGFDGRIRRGGSAGRRGRQQGLTPETSHGNIDSMSTVDRQSERLDAMGRALAPEA
jgi:hypothetical protein